jgi:hypothetical protein
MEQVFLVHFTGDKTIKIGIKELEMKNKNTRVHYPRPFRVYNPFFMWDLVGRLLHRCAARFLLHY